MIHFQAKGVNAMPTIDMPLEQLRAYQGTNPCPADFDAFWDCALEQMNAVEPNVQLVPSWFQSPVAECFDLYFTGVGGARVHAKYLKPKKNAAGAPAMLMFHGYTGSAGDWQDKLGYAASGFHVVAMDCRGQGGESEDVGGVRGNTHNGHIIRGLQDGPDKLLFRSIFLDTALLAKIVMDMPGVDPGRVGAMGGSQGGGLTLACAALEPRIARAAPVYPFLCDYRRVWEMDLAKEAYQDVTEYFRHFDPLHEREQGVFTALGYIDAAQLASRIRGEVLMATGLMDNICPPSTQFAAYNRIATPKSMLIYPDFGHEALPGCDDRIYRFMAALM
jgi:cephalosporin-C deacetylase